MTKATAKKRQRPRTSRPIKTGTNKKSARAQRPAPNIVSLPDYLEGTGKAILIHGPTGHGKTTLAVALAPRPTLVLDCDGGVDALEGVPKFSQIYIWKPADGVEYTWDDLDAFRDYVKGGEWQHQYKSILVDNVTAGQKPVIVFAISESTKRMNEESRNKRDPDIPSMQDWGKIYRVYDRWIRDIRDVKRLGVHIIFTAGTREWMDVDAGYERLQPNLEGSERNQIGTHMDAVGYLEVENGDRTLYLAPTGATVTKLRTPYSMRNRVIDQIENPDFDKLMAAVMSLPQTKEGGGKKKPTASKK